MQQKKQKMMLKKKVRSGDVHPVITPGRRQEWQYNIRYFGGDTQSFTYRVRHVLN